LQTPSNSRLEKEHDLNKLLKGKKEKNRMGLIDASGGFIRFLLKMI
jgi:hypothetical protein